jgi:hypothetical protein
MRGLITARNEGEAMTDPDIKTAARRVPEKIFPADDEAALAEVISDPEPADQMSAAASATSNTGT